MESDDEYDEETLLSMFGTDSLEEAEEEYRQVAIECVTISFSYAYHTWTDPIFLTRTLDVTMTSL